MTTEKRTYRKYTDEDLLRAIIDSKSWSQVITKLGLKAGGGTYAHLQRLATANGYDSSHFTGQAWNQGEVRPWNTNKRPLQEYLDGRPIGSHALKKRLWSEGLKEKACENEGCGITEWLGEPAPLELDHIDGDRSNNKLSNLRILCANCHAMTDTYCGKNKS